MYVDKIIVTQYSSNKLVFHQAHKLMVKPFGVQARLLRVVVAVKLVRVEVEVVVSQYNKNLPSLSRELSLTPDSSCSSFPSS